MDYEKAYKEALEKAKYLKENTDSVGALDISAGIEFIFNELKESEDERIVKDIVAAVETHGDFTQGRKEEIYAWLKKQFEQNPTDEVKPKFKVGDWITNGEYTWKVTDIKPLDYILQSRNGDTVDDTISYVDEEFHLWTIQDAKAGDVLAYPDGTIVIFKYRLDGLNSGIYMSYILLVTKIEISQSCVVSKDITPATKEQRDKLEKAITESGYKWNKEDLKLEKI